MSCRSGQSFLAGIVIGSGSKFPTREKHPLETVELSFDSQRVMVPTTFSFQPKAVWAALDPGPAPAVGRGRRSFSRGFPLVQSCVPSARFACYVP